MNIDPKQIGNEETEQSNIVRLPLWKTCVETILAEGIDYGKTYPAEYFEKALRCERNDMQFGLGVSEIRRALETKGFYLSGRGLKGDSFIILKPEKNQDVMQGYASAALDCLKRGVILGTNTRLDTLNTEERRRHESILEKLAMKLVLCKHSKQVSDLVKEKKPKLLSIE